MPKVSIVLPTYNGQQYIRESIDSIISQSFSDWELIIVNDCSTDSTEQIIKEYEKSDSRIHVINNLQNQRLPRTLNIGFREAKGEYLTWTSDDNLYMNTAIEKLVETLDKFPDKYMVCTNMRYIDSDGEWLDKYNDFSNDKMYQYNCLGACFMYRRQVLQEVGEYDPEQFLIEDYDYWLRIMFRYGDIVYIPEVLYKYRTHSASLTVTRRAEVDMALYKLRKKYLKYILPHIIENKFLITKMYYEFKLNSLLDDETKALLHSAVPLLKLGSEAVTKNKIIIYGAGECGEKIFNIYKDKIIYYVDKDIKKIGSKINGIEVISFDRLKEVYSDSVQIVVAAGIDKIYGFMETLFENDITNYFVYYKW